MSIFLFYHSQSAQTLENTLHKGVQISYTTVIYAFSAIHWYVLLCMLAWYVLHLDLCIQRHVKNKTG